VLDEILQGFFQLKSPFRQCYFGRKNNFSRFLRVPTKTMRGSTQIKNGLMGINSGLPLHNEFLSFWPQNPHAPRTTIRDNSFPLAFGDLSKRFLDNSVKRLIAREDAKAEPA
jgi:hypothetical protein